MQPMHLMTKSIGQFVQYSVNGTNSRPARLAVTRFLLSFVVTLPPSLHAQMDSTALDKHEQATTSAWEFSPRFRGAQLQGSILIFLMSYGGAVDVDVYRDSITRQAMGLRLSVDRFWGGDVGGTTLGPYLQSAVSARVSFVLGEWGGTDIYAGIAYRSITDRATRVTGETSPGVGPLLGWEVRIGPAYARTFGLLLKIGGGGKMKHMPVWGGIGLFVGWLQ